MEELEIKIGEENPTRFGESYRHDTVHLKATGRKIGFIQVSKKQGRTRVTTHVPGKCVTGRHPEWLLRQYHEETLGEREKRGKNIHEGLTYEVQRTAGIPTGSSGIVIEPREKITVEKISGETVEITIIKKPHRQPQRAETHSTRRSVFQTRLESFIVTANPA